MHPTPQRTVALFTLMSSDLELRMSGTFAQTKACKTANVIAIILLLMTVVPSIPALNKKYIVHKRHFSGRFSLHKAPAYAYANGSSDDCFAFWK